MIAIIAACMIMKARNDGDKRIQCAANLKNIVLAIYMYASDYGCYPPQLTILAEADYMSWHGSWWQCPFTGTSKPSSIDEFSLHCDYLYFGAGLKWIEGKTFHYSIPIDDDDLRRLVLVCDKPGNHVGYTCFAVATGSSFSHKKGNSIEELADKYGLLVPGYNLFPDQGFPGGNPVSTGIDEVEKPENR